MSSRTALASAVLVALATPAAAQTRPNLEALSITGPTAGIAGATLRARIAFRVDGTAPSFRWSAWLSPSGSVQGALPAGTFGPLTPAPGLLELEQTITLPAAPSGAYFLAFTVDSSSSVAESNEYDNAVVSTERIHVRAPSADLRVDAVRIIEPSRRSGEPVTIEVDLSNAGENAASFEVLVVASDDEAAGTSDPVIGRANVSLAAGQRLTRQIAGVVPALDTGDYHVAAIADPARSLAEPNEIDNLGLAADPLNVFTDTLSLPTTELPMGTVFIPYYARVEAIGGDGHFRFAVAGGRLPNGLRINAVTGEISGTPLESGPQMLDIEVRSGVLVDTRTLMLRVRESGVELTIVTPDLEVGTLGLPYGGGLGAAGGEPPYRWLVRSGALPNGLDLGSDGRILGVPTLEGRFSFIAEVSDALGGRVTAQFEIEIEAPSVVVLSEVLPPHPVGTPLDLELLVTGGKPPYDWTALSAPPPGLTLSEEGHLVGTPSQLGRFIVRVQVTDSSRAGTNDTALIHLEIEDSGNFRVITQTVPLLAPRQALELPLEVEGGDRPFRWSVAAGDTMPAGFLLEQDDQGNAEIRGLSIRPIAQAFTLRVEDARGRKREVLLMINVVTGTANGSSGCRCVATGSNAGGALLLALGLLALARRRRQRR